MPQFRVIPIDPLLTQKVRESLASPQYGFPAYAELAADQAPCRSCLGDFRLGEDRRLLFTYNPFEAIDPYPLPGPVYIHQDECAVFRQPTGFPEGLRSFSLMLEGYGRDRWLMARERPAAAMIETAIERMLENPAVDYIHLRSAKAGCYIARAERAA